MPAPTLDPLYLEFQEAVAGRYSLERELGRGGMGIVYLARDVRLDRAVAIKLLPPEMAAQPTLRERFLREARTAARLSHPYIVPIHAVEEARDFVFYVMTFVDGETLADRVRSRGPLPPADAARVLREVAWALAYAHAQGVVHRDIKPANILLERGSNRAMVTDFGIARVVSGGNTGEGELLGTPEYMSPEQASGEPVDGRSDLYSLGLVGYFATTGTLPFTGDARAVLAQQITKAPPPVTSLARSVPGALARTIDRCLAKDAAARFPTGEALAEALEHRPQARDEVPAPIRVFLDRRRNMAAIGVIAAGAGMAMGPLSAMLAADGGMDPTRLAVLGTLALALVAAGPGIIIARLRKVLQQGYSTDDIAAGARQLHERRREEFLYEYGGSVGRSVGLLRFVGIAGLAVFGVSAAVRLVGFTPLMDLARPGLIFGLYAGVFGTLLGNKWRRLRDGGPSRWASFWRGGVGQLLSRVASFRLGRRALPPDRPTELGIALNAESLYEDLPKEVRKSIGNVPTVIRDLESHARAMRARITELDESLGAARLTPERAPDARRALVSDLEAARGEAERRLADVVTALETLRLNLLRLRAGAGGIDSVTQDLANAQALGEDVERLLAGQHEVQRVLADGRRGD